MCVFLQVMRHCVYALLMSSCDLRGWSEGLWEDGWTLFKPLFSAWLLYCFLLFDNELLCTYGVVSSLETCRGRGYMKRNVFLIVTFNSFTYYNIAIYTHLFRYQSLFKMTFPCNLAKEMYTLSCQKWSSRLFLIILRAPLFIMIIHWCKWADILIVFTCNAFTATMHTLGLHHVRKQTLQHCLLVKSTLKGKQKSNQRAIRWCLK